MMWAAVNVNNIQNTNKMSLIDLILSCGLLFFFFCTDFLENVTNHRGVLRFPTDEDLNGAAVALFRLQDTYNLETSSIARGELNGIQYR